MPKLCTMLTVAVLLSIGATATAGVIPVTWNPDGSAGGDATRDIDLLDWNVANGLSRQISPGKTNELGTIFDFYHQCILAATNLGVAVNTPSGLNSTYEYT